MQASGLGGMNRQIGFVPIRRAMTKKKSQLQPRSPEVIKSM